MASLKTDKGKKVIKEQGTYFKMKWRSRRQITERLINYAKDLECFSKYLSRKCF